MPAAPTISNTAATFDIRIFDFRIVGFLVLTQTTLFPRAILAASFAVRPNRPARLLCDACPRYASRSSGHLLRSFTSWTHLNRTAKYFPCGTPHVQFKERVDMRAHPIFLIFAIATGCGITFQSSAFSQENRGTLEQQMACTPDVWRLCGAQVPDVDRITACLRRNTPQLSAPCRAVFEQGDNAPRRGEDRDYGQRRYDREYEQRRHDREYGQRRYDREYGPRPYDRDYEPRRYEDDDE